MEPTNNISSINEKIEQLRKNRGIRDSQVAAEDNVLGWKKRTPRQVERNRQSELTRRSHPSRDIATETTSTAIEDSPIPQMPWETDYPYENQPDLENTNSRKTGATDVFWMQAIICLVICIAYVVTLALNPSLIDKSLGIIRDKAAHDFSFRDEVYDTVGSFLTYLNQQRPVEPLPDAPPTTELDGAGGGINPTTRGSVPQNATLAPVIFTGHIQFPLKKDSYRITSNFGFREHPIANEPEFHTAADLAAPEGTRIYAVLEGRVEKSGTDPSLGNYVLLNHGNGFYSVYGHCSKLIAKEGAYIRAGEVIAKVGSSGVSTGNHLHFGLKKDNLWFDPAYVFNELQ